MTDKEKYNLLVQELTKFLDMLPCKGEALQDKIGFKCSYRFVSTSCVDCRPIRHNYHKLLAEEIVRYYHIAPKKPLFDVGKDLPYFYDVLLIPKYNENYGDDRICKCGHSYYRHFDTYDEDMEACGCKYCGCDHFEEAVDGEEDE